MQSWRLEAVHACVPGRPTAVRVRRGPSDFVASCPDPLAGRLADPLLLVLPKTKRARCQSSMAGCLRRFVLFSPTLLSLGSAERTARRAPEGLIFALCTSPPPRSSPHSPFPRLPQACCHHRPVPRGRASHRLEYESDSFVEFRRLGAPVVDNPLFTSCQASPEKG